MIDSGIANVADLNANNVVYSQDFTGDTVNGANDQYGHGTHVAGIIAGNGTIPPENMPPIRSRALPRTRSLINLRVLDANGNGTDSEVIAAIQEAIALKRHLQHQGHQPFAGRPGV